LNWLEKVDLKKQPGAKKITMGVQKAIDLSKTSEKSSNQRREKNQA